jgi:hypothetical protein
MLFGDSQIAGVPQPCPEFLFALATRLRAYSHSYALIELSRFLSLLGVHLFPHRAVQRQLHVVARWSVPF